MFKSNLKHSALSKSRIYPNRKKGSIRSRYSRRRSFLLKHIKMMICLAALILTHSLLSQSEQALETPQVRSTKLEQTLPLREISINPFSKQSDEGVSLVSACRNHHEELRYTLPSWVKVRLVTEIILVDWSSRPPLHFLAEELDKMNAKNPPLYIIHVTNQTKWEPSRAFNLGFRATHFSHILRVDCDHKVRHDFVSFHGPPSSAFFAGGRHLERSEVDEHLRGVLFIERNRVQAVGGYDERFQNLNFEQDELYDRLVRVGLKRMDVNYDKLLHLQMKPQHTNHNSSLSTHIEKALTEIESNVYKELKRSLPPWTYQAARRNFSFDTNSLSAPSNSTQSHRHMNVQYRTISTMFEVPSLLDLVSKNDTFRAQNLVVEQLLQEKCMLTSEISSAIPMAAKVKMFALMRTKQGLFTRYCKKRILIIHCKSSLVARVNALLSGLSFTQSTGRLLVIIWEKEDLSMKSLFTDLFEDSDEFVVIQELKKPLPMSFKSRKRDPRIEKGFVLYDLIGERHGKLTIRNDPGLHMFIKTDQLLQSTVVRHTSQHAIRNEFRRLKLHPEVRSMLHNLEDQGLERALGIHVGGSVSDADVQKLLNRTSGKVLTLQQRHGIRFGLYTDAEGKVRELLRQNIPGASLLRSPQFGKLGHGPIQCRQYFTKLLAFSKTILYASTHSDAFTSLVLTLREDKNHW